MKDHTKTPARRRSGRRLGAIALGAIAAIGLSACVATAPEGSDGPLRVVFIVSPTTLDPAGGCTNEDFQLTMALYTQLVQYGVQDDGNGFTEADPTTVEPYFAKSWDVSEDGLTYTFALNDGWTFPSGEPMNAEAVKYSIDRTIAANGCAASIVNDLYQDPNLIESIDAVDETTVVFNLSRPDEAFLLAMATTAASIVDPSLVEANGGDSEGQLNEWLASNDAGSGPFRLESFQPGTSAVLVADENFKGEAPASEEIHISWVKSDSAMLLKAQDGSTDITYGLSKNSVKTLEGNDDLQVIANTPTFNMQLLMPNNKEPWTNSKLREAVTYAIPYQDILDNVLNGYGELYYGPIPPTMVGYDEAASAPRSVDLEKAKALVADSGVTTPIDVTLDVLSGDTAQASIAVILQGALGEIGINVDVQTLSESAWGDAVYNGGTQMALRLDGPAVFNPGYYLQYDEDCRSAFNTGHICVDGNSDLLDTARSATSAEERDVAFSQLTKNWVAESPKAILYLDAATIVLSKDVDSYYYSINTDMRSWGKK